MHLAQACTSLLIRDFNYYVIEPLDHGCRDLDLKYCWCEQKCNSTFCWYSATIPFTRPKVPVYWTSFLLNDQLADYSNASFHNKYRFMVNSCNGLVCLVEDFVDGHGAIYNPTTGEFIILPESFNNDHHANNLMHFRVCGIGFNPKSNEYKVIRTFQVQGKDGIVRAEVLTLGTDSWKSVGSVPHSALELLFPTYLEGTLHWVFNISSIARYIVSFDLETEKFDSHSFPPNCLQMAMSIGVLEGCLSMCGLLYKDGSYHICAWVMKEIGAWDSWTELISFKTGHGDTPRSPGCYEPICSSNGALLLYRPCYKVLYYYDHGTRYIGSFQPRDMSGFQLISHTPTFIALKDIVTRENVKSSHRMRMLQGRLDHVSKPSFKNSF